MQTRGQGGRNPVECGETPATRDGVVMKVRPFRVTFFNALVEDTGPVHNCCQRCVDIPAALDSGHAVTLAKRAFERLEGVRHWRRRARTLDCQPVGHIQ